MVSDWKGEAGVHCADKMGALRFQWGWLVLETVDWHARFGTVQLATLVVSLEVLRRTKLHTTQTLKSVPKLHGRFT